jgi:hypothetical protein
VTKSVRTDPPFFALGFITQPPALRVQEPKPPLPLCALLTQDHDHLGTAQDAQPGIDRI